MLLFGVWIFGVSIFCGADCVHAAVLGSHTVWFVRLSCCGLEFSRFEHGVFTAQVLFVLFLITVLGSVARLRFSFVKQWIEVSRVCWCFLLMLRLMGIFFFEIFHFCQGGSHVLCSGSILGLSWYCLCCGFLIGFCSWCWAVPFWCCIVDF